MTLTITGLYEIPLSPQNQSVTVWLGANQYTLDLRYCRGDLPNWIMDIIDPISGNAIAAGLPLVTGTNILRQLEYLAIGDPGSFIAVYTDSAIDQPPTETNLGIQSHLVYGTTANV